VSKATGVPLAKIAARLMAGKKLKEFNLSPELSVNRFFIKTPVFPFSKFLGVDPILGPEMRSTGEVMGVAETFGAAFLKAMMAAGMTLPHQGTVFLSVNDSDKPALLPIAHRLVELGFDIVATRGTTSLLQNQGVPARSVFKVNEGRPNVVDLVKSEQIQLIINTPLGRASFFDEKAIRRAAVQYRVPCITTLTAASATVSAIESLQREQLEVRSLQEYHQLSSSR
jgi:carbamoyl-phosphate synthase large subunit